MNSLKSFRPEVQLFDQVYNDHSVLVYNFLYRAIGNREDAEDATVETFRRIHASLERFRGECSLKVWVMRIATNVAIRAKTKAMSKRTLSLETLSDVVECGWEPAASERTEQAVLDRDLAERLLAGLPEKQRAAVWLRVGLEQTDEEVAAILGVPVGTVKSWVWRSMAKLRAATQLPSKQTVAL